MCSEIDYKKWLSTNQAWRLSKVSQPSISTYFQLGSCSACWRTSGSDVTWSGGLGLRGQDEAMIIWWSSYNNMRTIISYDDPHVCGQLSRRLEIVGNGGKPETRWPSIDIHCNCTDDNMRIWGSSYVYRYVVSWAGELRLWGWGDSRGGGLTETRWPSIDIHCNCRPDKILSAHTHAPRWVSIPQSMSSCLNHFISKQFSCLSYKTTPLDVSNL